MNRWLTTEEIADLLRVNVRTIRRLIERGELRASRVGRRWRIRQEDLDAYLRSTANRPLDESPANLPTAHQTNTGVDHLTGY